MEPTLEMDVFTLDDVLRSSADGLFVIDRNRRFVLFSDGCERITGYDRASVVGTASKCHDVTECQDEQGRSLSGALCPGLQVFEGEVPAARQRMSVRRADGESVWVETDYTPLHGHHGEIAGVVGVVRDIKDTRELEEGLGTEMDEPRTYEPFGTATPHANIAREGYGDTDMQAKTEAGNRPLDEVLATIEKSEILGALQRADGQRTLAARLLGISRSRLYRRMEALGIDPREVELRGHV